MPTARRRRGRGKLTKLQRKTVRVIAQDVADRNQEFKRHTLSSTSSGVDYSGTLTDLSAISTGDTATTRDGEKVIYRRFRFRFAIRPSATDGTNLVRVIVFRWLPDSNSHAPTTSDILLNVGSAETPMSVKQPQFRTQYKVYYDKLFSVDTQSNTQKWRMVNLYKKLGVQKSVYQSTGTAGTSKLYMLAVSDSAATSHPTMNYYGELRFTDA